MRKTVLKKQLSAIIKAVAELADEEDIDHADIGLKSSTSEEYQKGNESDLMRTILGLNKTQPKQNKTPSTKKKDDNDKHCSCGKKIESWQHLCRSCYSKVRK